MYSSQIDLKKVKKFGFTFACVLLVAGSINFLKGHVDLSVWFCSFSIVFVSLAIFSPRFLAPVYMVFTKIARVIGWINTRIILCLVFYCMVTPIGFAMRFFKKDPIEKQIDKHKKTYWIKKECIAEDITYYEKPF